MPGRSQPQVHDVLDRGVYLHPFIGLHGERFAVAVDRTGRRVMEATIYALEDTDGVIDMLWGFLDRRDAGPLRLLR